MIPIFKLVSLIIRLFTKPMTNYFKQSLKSNKIEKPLIRELIISLGQKYNRWNIKITRSFSGMGGTDYIKPLSDDKALDSGAEFIGELLAYGTLMTWGIYEVNKLSKDTKLKEAKLNDQLHSMESEIKTLSSDYNTLLTQVNNWREEMEKKDLSEKQQA
jgi:hypothetical protein